MSRAVDIIKKYIRKYLIKHAKQRVFVRKVHVAEKKWLFKRRSRNVEMDSRTVVFETFMGRQYGCNPRAIYEYMLKNPRFKDFKYIWIFNDPESKMAMFPQLEGVETLSKTDREYYEKMASAKYIITNSNLDYGVTPKEGQVFLQTWHGTPLKRLRCDIEAEHGNALNSIEEIHSKNNLDVVRYDYFLSPSPFATDRFRTAFNLETLGKSEILVETGYPRNDILFNYTEEDVIKLKKELGIPENKKVILYAPTFRDNKYDGQDYVYDLHMDMDMMQKELGDEYVMLFRVHYFVADNFDFSKYEGFVYNVSGFDDISPLYTIADLLITDYSSVFFDYASLCRPIVFYMYDKEDYADDIRGFYISLDELPGPIVTEEADLLEEIKNGDREKWQGMFRAFNEKYNPYEDGNSSRRVCELLFGSEVGVR